MSLFHATYLMYLEKRGSTFFDIKSKKYVIMVDVSYALTDALHRYSSTMDLSMISVLLEARSKPKVSQASQQDP